MSDDSNLCFVDSNIWLYGFIDNVQNSHKTEIARKVILSSVLKLSMKFVLIFSKRLNFPKMLLKI